MVGRRLGPILVIATLIAGLAPAPADAALSPEAFEECLLEAINTDRATSGVGALQMASDIGHINELAGMTLHLSHSRETMGVTFFEYF